MHRPLLRRLRSTLAALTATALCCGGAFFSAGTATAADPPAGYPNLAPTPPMGWNNWSYYTCGVDEQIVLDNAKALVRSGLAAKGYRTVTVDDCWMAAQRDGHGELVPDPARFPHGMASLGRRLHRMGLKFGIYEDAGTSTCGGFPGSYGHYRQDAALFAKWGVDYLKLDGCNVPTAAGQTKEQTYHALYAQMSRALLDTGRPIVFSVSAPAYFQYDGDAVWHKVIGWSAEVGNLWREGRDIALQQSSGAAKWSSIAYNYGYNARLADLQRPGRWNDPDFLLAGDSGLTTDEIQSQMSLWSVMAAPLISSTDLTKASPAALRVLGNRDVIAVDQDPLGVQGRIVQHGTGYDVLSKPLQGGDRAVALFNSGDTARTITTTAARAGLPAGSSYLLRDLVTKAVTRTTGTIAADVPPHATVLYRVRAADSASIPPATAITWTPLSGQGATTTYRVGLSDDGPTALTDPVLAFTAPEGWQITPASVRLPDVLPGHSASAQVAVTAPAAAPGTTRTPITATAVFRSGRSGRSSVSGQATVVTVVPYPDLAAAYDNVGVTSESDPAPGDFDRGGDSYSAQALAAAGVTPGATVTDRAGGAAFTWPTAAPGTPDNVASAGEVVTASGQGSAVAFLGAETGQASGQVTVAYTDGTTSTGTLGFPNWCCTTGTEYGARTVVTTDHRDTPSGPGNYGIAYKVFADSVPLTPGKTLKSITLPDEPVIHVFAFAVVGPPGR